MWKAAAKPFFLLSDRFRVTPTEAFVAAIEQVLTPGSVELR